MMLLNIRRPSSIPFPIDENRSSAKTMSEASFATSEPVLGRENGVSE